MEPSASRSSTNSSSSSDPEARVRHLPKAAQAAFREFRASGDVAVLDPLIFAILENYAPRKPQSPLSELPGGTLLVDELGFDSLSIIEVVFFTEELFEITIANEEILLVRSLDDLRAFIRAKVSSRATS